MLSDRLAFIPQTPQATSIPFTSVCFKTWYNLSMLIFLATNKIKNYKIITRLFPYTIFTLSGKILIIKLLTFILDI